MSTETEVKLKVRELESVRARLGEIGAKPIHRRIENNVLFDRPDRSLHAAGRALRVRTLTKPDGSNGLPTTVTLKGPRQPNPGPVKVREEIEFVVSNESAARSLLETLGYETIMSFEKRRESWRLGACTIELDQLPFLGPFVEIEGPDIAAIETTRVRLGLATAQPREQSYASMLFDYTVKTARHCREIRFGREDPWTISTGNGSSTGYGSNGRTHTQASLSLAPMLRRLKEHIGGVRAERDDEDVHQVRVICGRIRVWLSFAGLRVLDDDLRWLRRAAAPLRNLDVLLADPMSDAFTAWLRTHRHAARADLLDALDAPRCSALIDALSALPPVPIARARAFVPVLTTKVLRQARGLGRSNVKLADLHALRKNLRVLRYALEWLDAKPRSIRKMQDALGLLGDLDVAREYFDAWPEHDRHADLADRITARIEANRQAARKAWPRTKRVVRRLG